VAVPFWPVKIYMGVWLGANLGGYPLNPVWTSQQGLLWPGYPEASSTWNSEASGAASTSHGIDSGTRS